MQLPVLPTRPKAETLTVSDILEAALAGRLRVPDFQTGLRWGAKNVEELFDSIVRGFPIGGLLLWAREGEAKTLTFGPVQVDAPDVPDARYIVDGQQRITALVGALLHPDAEPLGGTFALWVDLVGTRFEVCRERPPPYWIPVNLLGERRKLQHWARNAALGPDTEALVDRAFALEEAIIRYAMPAYVVRGADRSALRLIFSRVNFAGKPLDQAQVFEALFGEAKEAKPLHALAAWLDEQTGFGVLPTGWLLRCVKAVDGLSPRDNFSEHHRADETLLRDTREAMRRAITFLQADAGFPHAAVLPYRFPLIVLARFFHLHPEPHPRSRTLLTRWVWRGALNAIHSDSSNAAVAAHQEDLGQEEHVSVQRLLHRVPREAPTADPMIAWTGQAMVTRIYATLMLTLEPLDPTTEEPWSPAALSSMLSERSLGDVFRRPLDPKAKPIAARILLPARYVAHQLVNASEEVLTSLGVDPLAAEALRRGDSDAFITHRAAHLRALLERHARLRAAPGENDRPPMVVIQQAG
ncbi:MAG: DUF262 domain-containing protein [Alphaproteobacteria bacterium]|nr:DUF262 domain-containing protein [Alphaproteobacteria bacterium]